MRIALAFTGLMPLAVAATVALALPAFAGGWDQDRVFADSFGNLVVQSSAGYKRIVVGEGHTARNFSGYVGPRVVYLDRQDGAVARNCYRPPMLLKGRSYMYGFSEGEIPQPGLRCR